MFFPCPFQHSPPDLGAVMLPLHGPLIIGQRVVVIRVDAKPPRGVSYPQLGAAGILFGVSLEGQDRAVVAQEGLVPDQQLRETMRDRPDRAPVVLLQSKSPAAALPPKEELAGRGQLRFCDAQLLSREGRKGRISPVFDETEVRGR